jgi:uncharacterized phage protein (TIGR01671 family)
MKREIDYRGLNDGAWHYGYPHYNAAKCCHQIVEFIQTNPTMSDPCGDQFNQFTDILYQTLGQYTGVDDRKGTKIYDGDIVACKDGNNGTTINCEVIFYNGCFCTRNGSKYNHGKQIREYKLVPLKSYVIVVGNIHQNPELLKHK